MDELRMHLHSSPSPDGIAAICDAVEPGGAVTRVRRIGGGLGGVISTFRTRGASVVTSRNC